MIIEKDDKLVAVYSLKKNILEIILFLILTVLSVSYYLITEKDGYSEMRGVFGAILFGYVTIYSIYNAIAKKELVIIDKGGITDNSTSNSIGFIPWNDISNIGIKTVKNQKFISLSLNNEEKYKKEFSKREKILLFTKKLLDYGTVNITLNGTGVDVNKFYEKIIEYIKLKKLNILNIHIGQKEEEQTSII